MESAEVLMRYPRRSPRRTPFHREHGPLAGSVGHGLRVICFVKLNKWLNTDRFTLHFESVLPISKTNSKCKAFSNVTPA